MAGLQVGRAPGCSGCLGWGQQFQPPMFLGTQRPYATKALIVVYWFSCVFSISNMVQSNLNN